MDLKKQPKKITKKSIFGLNFEVLLHNRLNMKFHMVIENCEFIKILYVNCKNMKIGLNFFL